MANTRVCLQNMSIYAGYIVKFVVFKTPLIIWLQRTFSWKTLGGNSVLFQARHRLWSTLQRICFMAQHFQILSDRIMLGPYKMSPDTYQEEIKVQKGGIPAQEGDWILSSLE